MIPSSSSLVVGGNFRRTRRAFLPLSFSEFIFRRPSQIDLLMPALSRSSHWKSCSVGFMTIPCNQAVEPPFFFFFTFVFSSVCPQVLERLTLCNFVRTWVQVPSAKRELFSWKAGCFMIDLCHWAFSRRARVNRCLYFVTHRASVSGNLWFR